MNVLSLFAGIGVAEAYLQGIGVRVVVANELIERRAELYEKIYPLGKMICGDINSRRIYNSILAESKRHKIDAIIATPPCQGMSRAAGIPDEGDERNDLIIPVLELVVALKPKYVLLENVKRLLEIKIVHNKNQYSVSDLMNKLLGDSYHINVEVINTKNYSVPQSRERVIILMTRSDIVPVWTFPAKSKNVVTLRDVIGNLPVVDPFITDVSERELLELFPMYYERKAAAAIISHWHNPPRHIKRQVVAMLHTPTGKTAFDNVTYYPRKKNGNRISGYKSTYRRLRWDTPASTVTMDNRKISSQNNVHPGRFLGKDIKGDVVYSDPRVLTTYELMRTMSLPEEWPVPDTTSEPFLRSVIGEGIPPLFMKTIFEVIMRHRIC